MTFAYSSANKATAITGSISGTTLTVTARTGTVNINTVLVATGVTSCFIIKQLTGTAGATGTYIVSVSQTVASFTAGVVRQDTITQTGTDTSLAGLNGLTGVTTTVTDAAGGYVSYNLGTNFLLINGSLTIGGSAAPNEQLIAGFDTTGFGGVSLPVGQIQVAGTLILGASETANSVTDGFQNQVLIYQPGSLKGQGDSSGQSANVANYAGAFFTVIAGATFTWNYGTISCWGGIGFNTTAIVTIGVAGKRLKPVLDMSRARATNGQAQAQSVYSYCPITLNGLVYMGGSITGDATANGCIWIQAGVPTAFNGYEPRFLQNGFGGSGNMPTGTYTIANYAGNYGGLQDISKRAGAGLTVTYVMKNSALGTSLIVGSNNAGGNFLVNATQDLTVSGTTGGVVCFADSAGVFYQAPVSAGVASFTNILVGAQLTVANTVWTQYFGSTDTASLNQWAYGQQYASANSVLRGAGGSSATILSLPDTSVTLSQAAALTKLASSFTVNTSTNTITVTANSTLDDLYDSLKAWKCTATQVNLQYPSITTQPVTVSGSSLVTAMNIVVNSGITLSAGTKFTGITTAGSVTSAGTLSCNVVANVTSTGTISSGVTITGNVSQDTPTNLTSVTVTGNLTYNIVTSPTVTFISTSISGTVSNSGSGTVTISTSSSTIGTVGTRITTRPVTSLTISGLTSGSQIYIANGSGAQVAYVSSSSTSYTLDTTGQTGTWSWKVARYGYTAQTGSHSPAVAITSVTVTLVADAFITQSNKATVAAYTILDNMDRLYDYASYYETTNAGIKYSRVITKAGTNASAGSYPVTLNSTAVLWTFDGSSLSIWAGYTLYAGSTITGALFTSGNVTVPANISNTAITANVVQNNPTDMSGMTIDGNLTYNNSDSFPLTVTLTNCTVSGQISNAGFNYIKVVKAGTSPWFNAGSYVEVVAYVSLTTANSLALSSYVFRNGIDNGWVVQNTARVLEMNETDTFQIYAIAYGYQPVLFTAVATDPTTFKTSLLPETYVDTTLPTGIRNTISATITIDFDLTGHLVAYFSTDLSQYSPANVLNGFQYNTVVSGSAAGLGAIMAGTLDGFNIISGGVEISSPGFYAQVNDSVTTVGAAGFSIPIVINVLPSVYIADPTYTPTRKNTSGIVLQTAPWTQQTATISQADKADIAVASAATTWDTPKADVTATNSMGAVVKSTGNNANLIPALL